MFCSCTGLVPEQASQVAQNGEMLGTFDDNGRVWTVRRHGPPFAAAAGDDRQVGQRERVRRAVAARYGHHLIR